MFRPVLGPSSGVSAQEHIQKDKVEKAFQISTLSSCVDSCADLPEDGLSTARNM